MLFLGCILLVDKWYQDERIGNKDFQRVDKKILQASYAQVMLNYRNGINKGLYKIMSKMGISTVASYRCSQLFEAVGLNDDVVELCFAGVDNRINGADFNDFEHDLFNLIDTLS